MGAVSVITLAAAVSFIICLCICPVLIPFLRRLKFGQQVRDDGPEAHLKKQGTPTMGGLAFLLSIAVASLIFSGKYPNILPVLLVGLGYGLIGFLDDFLKVVKKQSEGLKAWQKMLLQIVIMAVFCVYLMKYSALGTVIHIPFGGPDVDLKWFYPVFVFLTVVGTDNGANFTDGVDGLCSSVTLVIAVFLTIASVFTGTGIEPVTAAMAGGLMGFLAFNAYPAKVFMGDTGSLALGGFVAASFLMIGQPLLIIIVCFIYLAEVASVMIQVGYFKLTHGKRIFRMAPIHHHFELGGWSETRVVTIFTIVTIMLSLVGLIGLGM